MLYKLRTIFAWSIPVFMMHGIEEYVMGFPNADPIFGFVFQPILMMDMADAVFITFQIMLWVLLIMALLMLHGEQWQRHLLVVPGMMYLFEFHHIFEAIVRKNYYPGMFTAILFPVFAVLFWKEYLHDYRESSSNPKSSS